MIASYILSAFDNTAEVLTKEAGLVNQAYMIRHLDGDANNAHSSFPSFVTYVIKKCFVFCCNN